MVPVRGREVEPAALLVREELDREQREPVRLEKPAKLARGDVELEEASSAAKAAAADCNAEL